jgi:V8-like Glu-specific endopeptidase
MRAFLPKASLAIPPTLSLAVNKQVLATLLGLSAYLPCQVAEAESTSHFLQIDSGLVGNNLPGPSAVGIPQVVWSTIVNIPESAWLRLEYQSVMLSGSPNPGGDGSFLRLTSMKDGGVQTQHMRHVGEWRETSAYFNGDSILVELLAQPGTGANRLVIKKAIAGPHEVRSTDSICGTVDDRTLSYDDRMGRVWPVGCTAWMINDCNHCFLSAGHCTGSSFQVVEFNVPLSSAGGSPQHPAPSDQYAIDGSSLQTQSGGTTIGNDWAYFGVFDNATSGLSAYAAQGSVAFDLSMPPAVGSQNIRITGYGSTSSPVSPTWYLVQKTHVGPYNYLSGTTIRYETDTTGGNSGSPVLIEGTNEAIGIHTNAGCNSVGGNQGCGNNNADLVAALANPLGVCAGPCGSPPLTTTFANNNGGGIGGAVYFSLEALAGSGGVTISDLDLNSSSAIGSAVSIDVYVQPNSGSCSYDPSGVWVLKTSGTGVTAGPSNPSNFVLTTPLEIGEGCCLGVAIVANGFSHAYTTGSTNPQVFSNADLQLTAGAASNVPFNSPIFEPRIVNTNIHYVLGGSCSDIAVADSYGEGCVTSFTSYYEQLTQAGMDLSNLEIYAANSPSGLVVNTRPAQIDPIGSLGTATALTLGDDNSISAGSLGLHVGSNCWVAQGPGNSSAWSPTVATMLSNPSTALYAWTDLNPSDPASGQVYYEESGNNFMVTYDGVYLWQTSDPVFVQFRGNVLSGAYAIRFGALSSTGPEDWLVGRSAGGASTDPGGRDLSLASLFGFSQGSLDQAGLALAPVNSPVLGQPFVLETTNIPPSAVFHVGVVGLSQLSVPLAFVVPSASTSCTLYASSDLIMGPEVVFGGPGNLQWQGIDLTSVAVLGFDLYFQSATLDLSVLSATTRTSNGVMMTTGLY